MAAHWSELPNDLLILIWKHLDNELDLIRFRSVCSNWRSSTINFHNILPFKFPIVQYFPNPIDIDSINNVNNPFCYLSKQSFFLIKPPPQQRKTLIPWLIRISQNSHGKTKIFHPIYPNFYVKSHVIDFDKFPVFNLGTNFVMDEDIESYKVDYTYPGKIIAVMRHGKKPIVFGTLSRSVLFKCGDENWKVIPNMSTFLGCIKGKPYGFDRFGRTVCVGLDLSVEFVAEREPFIGGGKVNFLVESEDELFLVDVYKRDRKIELFKLNEEEKKWIKWTSLGNKVMFLGNGYSFSVSASDLSVAKGNCVIFLGDVFESCLFKDEINVLDLENEGRISSLSDHPEYLKLFWPPPKWIVKSYVIVH